MENKFIFAGFGGQGVLTAGQIVALAGMVEDKFVSWMPSYGPEMRGGSANCSVVVSDALVGSPIVDEANTIVVMNKPSLDTFEDTVVTGGYLIYNESLIDTPPTRTDITCLAIPCNGIAKELGNIKIANMVSLGAFIAVNDVVSMDSVIEGFKEKFGEKKKDLFDINILALNKGFEYAKKEVLCDEIKNL